MIWVVWVLSGLLIPKIFKRLKLPHILGYIFIGMIVGGHGLDWINESIMNASGQIRECALMIILLRVGLAFVLEDFKTIGRPSFLLAFVPALFEMGAVLILAPILFGISFADALLMGSVLAAVSPAVVMPRMIFLIEEGYGEKKPIPQMIMAGASFDDIIVLVIFSACLTFAQEGKESLSVILNIPISILTGIGFGILMGTILITIIKKVSINATAQIILLCIGALGLLCAEELLEEIFVMSGFLAVICMGIVAGRGLLVEEKKAVSDGVMKIWKVGEVLLFTLVGAEVNVGYVKEAGFAVVCLIALSLLIRSIGVYLCVSDIDLSKEEILFCIISYLPKATVQAGIGGIPLAMGLGSGNLILTMAVMAILITAPLGAILIDGTYEKFLKR